MENENVVNFFAYYNQKNDVEQTEITTAPSEELGIAIQHLIQRLRDCKPLNQVCY